MIQLVQLDSLAASTMRKVSCPDCGGTGYVSAINESEDHFRMVCQKCVIKGEILDPQLTNLREVLWVKCAGPHETQFGETVCQLTDADDYEGEKCMGSGYVRRWVQDWPKGALAGALADALVYSGEVGLRWNNHAQDWTVQFNPNNLGKRRSEARNEDLDPAVISAVLQFVEQNSPQRSQGKV